MATLSNDLYQAKRMGDAVDEDMVTRAECLEEINLLQSEEIAKLRAQVAEQNDLLRKAFEALGSSGWECGEDSLMDQIDAILLSVVYDDPGNSDD